MLHSLTALLGVAGTIREEQAVELQLVEVIIPRHANDLHTSLNQASDNVCLNAAIYEHNLLASSLIVANHFLAAHFFHPVDRAVVLFRV